MASLAGIVLGIALFAWPGLVLAQDFEGAEFCQDCHEVNYSLWKASGHPYKLMKSEEARNRPIPLPIGYTWDDISYVIGGYKWKSRYIDNDGYIITTTFDEDGNEVDGVNQYNMLVGYWSDYHAGEEDLPYDCGRCHTTNWVENENPEDTSGNQDGLAGMWGTFDAGGIQCEQCHGNGMTMEIDDSAEACGACHIRGEPDTIPASGGFVRHHEQYNEFLASPHSNMKCTTCHNPHARGEFSIVRECDVCHSGIAQDYAMTTMADYNVECKDCHMPWATKSAKALGPHQGDLQTHIFYIDTDAEGNMFSEDGLFVNLDDDGKAAVTMDFACQRCHETAALSELEKFATSFHDPDMANVGLTPGLTGNWWNAASSGEGFQLEFGYNAQGELVIFAAFYTYDSEGNQVFLVAFGTVSGMDLTVDVDVFITDGGSFGGGLGMTGTEVAWGTGTFTFFDCGDGDFTLTPNAAMAAAGFTELAYDLTRDLLESGIQCPTFVNNAQ
jgi:hypothetical protein